MISPIDTKLSRLRLLFAIGMVIFFISILTAAILYPGGNRFDAQFPHFSLQGNFLCDLFDRDGYNRIPNPGRPFAVLSAYAFALSMILFWAILPNLFRGEAKAARYVRIFGVSAMVILLFIATPLHDWCIRIAVPCVVIAFIIAIRALGRSGHQGLARLGVVSVAICVINYLSLIFRFFPATLPGLQKVALLVFLVWVLSAGHRLGRSRA